MPDFGFADYTAHTPNPFAQFRYVRAVAACVPEAWRELAEIPDGDDGRLHDWAQRRGFTDAWAITAARRHREHWRRCPDVAGHVLPVGGAAWEPVMPAFGRWDPFTESRDDVRARFDRYLEACAARPGTAKTPPDKRTGEIHFEWVALHVAGGLRYSEIAERYQDDEGRPDVPAVSRAITATAALIGLTLPPAPGRRKLQPSHNS